MSALSSTSELSPDTRRAAQALPRLAPVPRLLKSSPPTMPPTKVAWSPARRAAHLQHLAMGGAGRVVGGVAKHAVIRCRGCRCRRRRRSGPRRGCPCSTSARCLGSPTGWCRPWRRCPRSAPPTSSIQRTPSSLAIAGKLLAGGKTELDARRAPFSAEIVEPGRRRRREARAATPATSADSTSSKSTATQQQTADGASLRPCGTSGDPSRYAARS